MADAPTRSWSPTDSDGRPPSPHPRALVPLSGVPYVGVLCLFDAEVAGDTRPCLLLNGPSGVKAFVNVCAHRDQPVVLTPGPFEPDGTLLCEAHGAKYEVEGGACVGGPCVGDALRPVPLESRDGWWWVAEDPVDDSIYASDE